MKPSTNIPTPSVAEAWMENAAKEICDYLKPGFLAWHKIESIIAKHAPSPSPVPTDDGLEMAARDTVTITLQREEYEAFMEALTADAVPLDKLKELLREPSVFDRALKGNSLPAPAEPGFALGERGTMANPSTDTDPTLFHRPAPAIEDGVVERAKRAAERIYWKYAPLVPRAGVLNLGDFAQIIAEEFNLLQSTTPPAVSGRDK